MILFYEVLDSGIDSGIVTGLDGEITGI